MKKYPRKKIVFWTIGITSFTLVVAIVAALFFNYSKTNSSNFHPIQENVATITKDNIEVENDSPTQLYWQEPQKTDQGNTDPAVSQKITTRTSNEPGTTANILGPDQPVIESLIETDPVSSPINESRPAESTNNTATSDSTAETTIPVEDDQETENSPSPLFSDNFSGSLSQWSTIWTGYGSVGIEDGLFSIAPKPYTPGEDYHSVLAVAGDSEWTDYVLEAKINLVEQLDPAKEPWETGCFVLRYQDPQNFYYLCHKTNGLELDRFENGVQYFLATPTTPIAKLNQWYDFKISIVGNNFKVWVDNVKYIDYTDTAKTAFTGGKVGVYSEEAHVHYDDFKVTPN